MTTPDQGVSSQPQQDADFAKASARQSAFMHFEEQGIDIEQMPPAYDHTNVPAGSGESVRPVTWHTTPDLLHAYIIAVSQPEKLLLWHVMTATNLELTSLTAFAGFCPELPRCSDQSMETDASGSMQYQVNGNAGTTIACETTVSCSCNNCLALGSIEW